MYSLMIVEVFLCPHRIHPLTMLPHVLASTVGYNFPSMRYIASIAVHIIRHNQIILPPSLLPVHPGMEHHHLQITDQTQLEHNNGNNLRSGQPKPTPLADFPHLTSPLAHPVSLFNPSNQHKPTISLEHQRNLSTHSRQTMRQEV